MANTTYIEDRIELIQEELEGLEVLHMVAEEAKDTFTAEQIAGQLEELEHELYCLQVDLQEHEGDPNTLEYVGMSIHDFI